MLVILLTLHKELFLNEKYNISICVFKFNNFVKSSKLGSNKLNTQYNYEHNNKYNTSIYVDSFKIISSDTLFYLNRIVTDCNICTNPNNFLNNQATFLNKQVKKQNSTYYFLYPNSIILKTNAILNESWTFDTINNITAEIIAIEEDSIFNDLDSVKTILLSNNDTIKFSKNHGIIQFKDKFNLIGIQTDSTFEGLKIPTFKDIYKFEIGDVFQYVVHRAWVSSDGNGWENSTLYYKLKVLSKTIYLDSVEYTFKRTQSNFGTYSTTFTKQNTNFSDAVNNQLAIIQNENYTFYGKCLVSLNDSNIITKKLYNSIPFTLSANDILEPIGGYIMDANINYEPGLGNTNEIIGFFEASYSKRLIGYIKNNVQYGTVYLDSFAVSIPTIETANNYLQIYPNPSKNLLNIIVRDANNLGTIDIFDVLGNIVVKPFTLKHNNTTLNVSSFEKGIYYVRFYTKNNIYIQRFIKN